MYRVTATLKFPPALERPAVYYVTAPTAAAAIKDARKQKADDGHMRQDGPVTYRAELVDE